MKKLFSGIIFILGILIIPTPTLAQDHCANAIDIPVFNYSTCGDMALEPIDFAEADTSFTTPYPTCGNFNANTRDLWYSYTVPAGVTEMAFHMFNSDVIPMPPCDSSTPAMAIYRGNCGALTLLDCFEGEGEGNAEIRWENIAGLVPGETIYMRVWDENNLDQQIFIAASVILDMPEDNCDTPIPLSEEGCNILSTGGDIDAPETCDWNCTDNSVFYTFTVDTSDTQPYEITVTDGNCYQNGGGFESGKIQFAVYDWGGDCDGIGGSFASETPNDSTYHGCVSGTGTVTFSENLPVGDYVLAMDGYSTLSGNSLCTYGIAAPFLGTGDNPSETLSICAGESYSWQGTDYTESGTYTSSYTAENGCDSTCTLELTVNPSPQQVTVLSNPYYGIIETENTGEISLSTSYTGTNYWVTMGTANFTEEIAGNGTELSLGTNFPAGTFNIWSSNEFGCELLQGSVTFVMSMGNNCLVANITFGTPATNFSAGEGSVILYNVDSDMNEAIFFDQIGLLNDNGQVIFENIEAGDYYLGSYILTPNDYNVASHMYYQTALTYENAISITMTDSTIFVADIHHPQLVAIEGSNSGGGIVGEGGSKSELSPIENMVVILRDVDADEIIDVCVTNENGEYIFPIIPDNTNIQMYVTSLEHQEWTPYNVLTETGTQYAIDFLVDGNQVYPYGLVRNSLQSVANVNIYPNPTNGQLIIEAENIENITITNLQGQILLSKSINTNSVELDLSAYSNGIYLIKVETNEGVKVEKIVVE